MDSILSKIKGVKNMAEPILPCNCVPFVNECCCGPISGISVSQPACQSLPDGRIVNNPAYDPVAGKSYWSYKFLTDCGQSTRAISNFVIPICGLIRKGHVVVSEKIDGCGTFKPVPFDLSDDDPNFGEAPEGFQWLKVETDERFDKGVSVAYRIEINGDFPTAVQPILVKASTNTLTFDCGCFLVPQCNPQGKLAISKECDYEIVNNQVTLSYSIDVDNIGSGVLNNVQYLDTLFIPPQLSLGTIVVSPPSLSVNTIVPGQVTISGNLGTINPGGEVLISYSIPITGISSPGRYIIANMAMAAAAGTEARDSCSITLDVVQLNRKKCCNVTNGNRITFTVTLSSVGNSPDTVVSVVDTLVIPPGVTVQFNDFGGCTATFTNSGNPVPINTNVTGPTEITISCNNVAVSGMAVRNIILTVVSSTAIGNAIIANTVDSVTPVNPGQQVFLGAGNLPVEADVQVQLGVSCLKPC